MSWRLAAALTITLAGVGGARAQSAPLAAVSITADTDRTIDIHTDPSLAGSIHIDNGDGCVEQTGGSGAIALMIHSCDGSGEISVGIPSGLLVNLVSAQDGEVHASDLHGPLNATFNGSGDARIGQVSGPVNVQIHGSSDVVIAGVSGPAIIGMAGSGDVRIGRQTGPVEGSLHGSGTLIIGGIEADAVRVQTAGSGDILIGGGTIVNLQAETDGSGDIGIAATTTNAQVRAHGGGDIKLGQVTGQLAKDAGGGSDIYVGGGVVNAVLKQVAGVASTADHRGGSYNVTLGRDSGQSLGWRIVSGVLIIVMLVLIWRAMQRRGGIAAVTQRVRGGSGAAAPAVPQHPGVLAVRETMARLDARLAKLEGYVTSREFDLQRKFRELDTPPRA